MVHVFSDKWKETDGGHFETYESNDAKEPIGTHDLWLPKRNSFNFFKVTQRSHHQVREILTNVKTRRSLTGWFHTRDALPPRAPLEAVEPKYIKKELFDFFCLKTSKLLTKKFFKILKREFLFLSQ